MTSEERREARYKRRVAARLAKKSKYASCNDFSTVFSYGNLYRAYRRCRRGVAWKASVQRYITNAPLNVLNTFDLLHAGKYRSPGFNEFDIRERGKQRHIQSTTMSERVVQRCLCDNSLVPLMTRTFIYDNGACMINKGYDFAIRRLTQHLHEHYRKHGREGYILLYDFSKFFDNISHEVIKRIVRGEISDERILRIIDHFIDAFGARGLGLGSQVSQVLSLATANRLDHYIKERLRIRGYGRYSDDGYLIHWSKDYLKGCLKHIRAICNLLGIIINEKKTQIVKLSHGFTWLKVRFFITETGKVIRKICKNNVTRARRKMKKMQTKWLAGIMPLQDIRAMAISQRAYMKKFNAYHTIRNYDKLYNDLFIFIPWEEEYYALHQGAS